MVYLHLKEELAFSKMSLLFFGLQGGRYQTLQTQQVLLLIICIPMAVAVLPSQAFRTMAQASRNHNAGGKTMRLKK